METKYCSSCGTSLTAGDEEGLCHLCKLSIIFNNENIADIEDFAC